MGSPFASSKKAIAYCDVCGWQYKLKELRSLIVKGRDTNIKACPECWNGDHPQLKLGEFPVNDPQALRDPRPDTSLGEAGDFSSRDIQWSWNPVGGWPDNSYSPPNRLVAVSAVGTVTVETT